MLACGVSVLLFFCHSFISASFRIDLYCDPELTLHRIDESLLNNKMGIHHNHQSRLCCAASVLDVLGVSLTI
jgi:hypothetical protein